MEKFDNIPREMSQLEHFDLGAHERCVNLEEMSAFDFVEPRFSLHGDVPAFSHMGIRTISRKDALEYIDVMARMFRALGVQENEVVPVYAPFTPVIGCMMLALNKIGAVPHFLKLSIPKKEVVRETEGSRFAVVFDGLFGLYNEVKDVFNDDRFKKVIVTSMTDLMLSPDNIHLKELAAKMLIDTNILVGNIKAKSFVPNDKKYIKYDKAIKMAKYHTGIVRVEPKLSRLAYITSSSGTSGGVKHGKATNHAVISQVLQDFEAKVGYMPGDSVFSNLPLTASTSNNFFHIAMYNGLTVKANPVIDIPKLYTGIRDSGTQFCLLTGSMAREFFEQYKASGDKRSMPTFKAIIIGGEGVPQSDLFWMEELAEEMGFQIGVFIGCGLTETWSTIAANSPSFIKTPYEKRALVPSIGVPYAATSVGIYDKDGNLLPKGKGLRGELRVNVKETPTVMMGYHNNVELTEAAYTADGSQLKTGDDYEQDAWGKLYIYGRLRDCIVSPLTGVEVKLYDMANYAITDEDYLDDFFAIKRGFDVSAEEYTIALEESKYDCYIPDDALRFCHFNVMEINGKKCVLGHLVFHQEYFGRELQELDRIHRKLAKYVPKDVLPIGYTVDQSFDISLTTLKTNRDLLEKRVKNYYFPGIGVINKFDLVENNDGTISTSSIIPAQVIETNPRGHVLLKK